MRNEYTFGTNRIYLLFDRWGFSTNFYIAVDPQIINQYKEDINSLNCKKFVLWQNGREINFDRNVIFFRHHSKIHFWRKPPEKFFLGGSVTYVAMQLAFYMGFSPVILVGVDHSYSVTRNAKGQVELLAYEGRAGDHFASNYYERGDVWVAPDLEKMELGYRIAKFEFESNGRQILDATIGGKLKIFPKVEYDSLF